MSALGVIHKMVYYYGMRKETHLLIYYRSLEML